MESLPSAEEFRHRLKSVRSILAPDLAKNKGDCEQELKMQAVVELFHCLAWAQEDE